jgi:hypothetical protein
VKGYKKGEASLGRAAELAGVPVGQMMTILTEFGEESRTEDEDYLQGHAALRKSWRRFLKVFYLYFRQQRFRPNQSMRQLKFTVI